MPDIEINDNESNDNESNDDETNENITEEAFDSNILQLFDVKNLTQNAFLLGVQAYLMLEPYHLDFYSYIQYSEIVYAFKRFTDLELNNNESNIQQGRLFTTKYINGMGNKSYYYLCNQANKNMNNIFRSHTPEEKVRSYLGRSDVTSMGKNKFGMYVVEICKKLQIEKIYSDHHVQNICYQYLPVKTKSGELMFIDENNYAHHYSEARRCTGFVDEELSTKAYYRNKIENESYYDLFINWIIKKLHLNNPKLKIGWWSFNMLTMYLMVSKTKDEIIISKMKYFIIFFYFLTYFVKVNGCRSNKYDIESLDSGNIDPVVASKGLNEYVDINVDPCEDFYQFTCGKWIESIKERKDYNSTENYSIRELKFNDFVLDIMSKKIKTNSRALKKIIEMEEKCEMLKDQVKKENCTNLVKDFRKYAFATIFINERLRDKEVKYGLNVSTLIFNKLKEEFKLLIDEKKDIFDENSRKNLLKKLSKLKFDMKGTIEKIYDTVEMEKCYSYLKTSVDDDAYKMFEYLENLKSSNISFTKNIKDKNDYENNCLFYITRHGNNFTKYAGFNAFYNHEQNVMAITTEVLREPIYHKNYPLSFLYSGVGYIIGHEMLHAFESEGIMYDENGKNGTIIITSESKKKFKNKTDCFEKQYSNAKEPNTNLKVKGNLTLDENLADNGSIKIAHRAYMKYLESIGRSEPKIPGFESFTNEQLFFISFGRTWCSVLSNNSIEHRIENDVHSPGNIRLKVTLANYKPFSKAFNCKLGSKMNPSDKCELWLN
uniref:Peptidase_M13 domain-containing protein n=1 Tax=Strongyloides stercoralis TaxID=6248 RepID=A0A0K0EMS5_STRER